ncbi:glutathione transferase [Aureococcus anophagefferens]|nr:glutathione transferase [Aureococcus anophagefferens]
MSISSSSSDNEEEAAQPDAPAHALTYFSHRAALRCDLTQLLFALSDTPLKIERVLYPEFLQQKATYPGGQLPVLRHGGRAVGQSKAIARYAATLGDLYPSDAGTRRGRRRVRGATMFERFGVEKSSPSCVVGRRDRRPAGGSGHDRLVFVQDRRRAAALATTLERFEVIAPEIQARLRDNFMREASPWLVGGDMSLADVAWYAALHEIATIQALGAPPAPPAPDDAVLADLDALLPVVRSAPDWRARMARRPPRLHPRGRAAAAAAAAEADGPTVVRVAAMASAADVARAPRPRVDARGRGRRALRGRRGGAARRERRLRRGPAPRQEAAPPRPRRRPPAARRVVKTWGEPGAYRTHF